jgi:hypothetical protein
VELSAIAPEASPSTVLGANRSGLFVRRTRVTARSHEARHCGAALEWRTRGNNVTAYLDSKALAFTNLYLEGKVYKEALY